MCPSLASPNVGRYDFFSLLSRQGIQRALQLIGIALNISVLEFRDVRARCCARCPGECQAVRKVKVGVGEVGCGGFRRCDDTCMYVSRDLQVDAGSVESKEWCLRRSRGSLVDGAQSCDVARNDNMCDAFSTAAWPAENENLNESTDVG